MISAFSLPKIYRITKNYSISIFIFLLQNFYHPHILISSSTFYIPNVHIFIFFINFNIISFIFLYLLMLLYFSTIPSYLLLVLVFMGSIGYVILSIFLASSTLRLISIIFIVKITSNEYHNPSVWIMFRIGKLKAYHLNRQQQHPGY